MSTVGLSTSGPHETVVPPEPADIVDALTLAEAMEGDDRRAAVAKVVADHPRSVLAWATLATTGRDVIETYAANRIGYHRGLDLLRANGWRGTGYVRWRHETNRPFLTALAGLSDSARAIGEDDEVERCEVFLRQLDPDWPPSR
jgi:hypothetical protein